MKMRIYYDPKNSVQEVQRTTVEKAERDLQNTKNLLDQKISDVDQKVSHFQNIVDANKLTNPDVTKKMEDAKKALEALKKLRQSLDTMTTQQFLGLIPAIGDSLNAIFRTQAFTDKQSGVAEEFNAKVENINKTLNESLVVEKNLNLSILPALEKEYGFRAEGIEEYSEHGLRTKLLEITKDKGLTDKGMSEFYNACLQKWPYDRSINTKTGNQEVFSIGINNMNKEELKTHIKAILGDVSGVQINTGRSPELFNTSDEKTLPNKTPEQRTDTGPITQEQQKIQETQSTQSQEELEKNYSTLNSNLETAINSKDFNKFKEAFSAIAKETKRLRETRNNNNPEPTRKAIKKYVDLLIAKSSLNGMNSLPAEASTYVNHEIAFAILQQDAQYTDGTSNRAALADKYLPKVEMTEEQIMSQVYYLEHGYFDYFSKIGTIIGMQRDGKKPEEINPLIEVVAKGIYKTAIDYKNAGWKTTLKVKAKDGKTEKELPFNIDQHGLKEKYEELIGNFEGNFPDRKIRSGDTGKLQNKGEHPSQATGKNPDQLKGMEKLSEDDKANLKIYADTFREEMNKKQNELPMPKKELWDEKSVKTQSERQQAIKNILGVINTKSEGGSILIRDIKNKNQVISSADLAKRNIPSLENYGENLMSIQPIIDKEGFIRGLIDSKNGLQYNFTRVPHSLNIDMKSYSGVKPVAGKPNDKETYNHSTGNNPWKLSEELVNKWKQDNFAEYKKFLKDNIGVDVQSIASSGAQLNEGKHFNEKTGVFDLLLHINTIVLPKGTTTSTSEKDKGTKVDVKKITETDTRVA